MADILSFRWWDPNYPYYFACIALFYIALMKLVLLRFRKEMAGFTEEKKVYLQSCCIATTHGILSTIGSAYCLANSPTNEGPLSLTCKLLMCNSLTYITIDTYLLRDSDDIAMKLHHWLGIPSFGATLLQNADESTIVCVLLMVEPTSPILNIKLMLDSLSKGQWITSISETYFGLLFAFLRVFPYYNIIFKLWESNYNFMFTKILASANWCLSSYWSYVIFCKFLKAFTKAKGEGDNNSIVAALNAVKNFTNKTVIGKVLLFTTLFLLGFVNPIMKVMFPDTVKALYSVLA